MKNHIIFSSMESSADRREAAARQAAADARADRIAHRLAMTAAIGLTLVWVAGIAVCLYANFAG